ncbi:MAG: DUF4249 domain-containing protein [Flavobacteriaceae bacterium]|nr:DUF4249 domain-containing protein [Flavobacteriaceae bacterium]
MLLLFNNCVEEIEFNDSSFDKLLVVQAALTDEYKIHEVKLSRISTLNAAEVVDTHEENAIVSIIEDSQITYNFQEKAHGVYESISPFKAVFGKQYSLQIKTPDGEIYESTLEEIQGINNIDEVYAEPDTDFYGVEGLTISVKSTSCDKNAKYYKYTYTETYKIIAPYYSKFALRVLSDVFPWKVEKYYQNEDREVCYNTINSKKIIQTETSSLSENKVILPVRFIKKNDTIIAHRYSIEVKQHVQSYEAYTYFKTLSKLSHTENVFSQTQQGFLQGNVMPTVNQKNKVVGFFEVNSTSKKRLFFNHTDLFPDHYINTRTSCEVFAPPLFQTHPTGFYTDFSPLVNAIKAGYLYTEDNGAPSDNLPGPFQITTKKCGDCRVDGSIVKPNFWID